MRRINGKNGWVKTTCHWSPTGWAWGEQVDAESPIACTCEPCKPPRGYPESPVTHANPDYNGTSY